MCSVQVWITCGGAVAAGCSHACSAVPAARAWGRGGAASRFLCIDVINLTDSNLTFELLTEVACGSWHRGPRTFEGVSIPAGSLNTLLFLIVSIQT